MSARAGRYAAAYTHREPSRDDELRLLLRWIVGQPANGLLFVGPEARAIDNSTIASGLVRSGNALYTTWRNKDSWRQERVIALWPNAKVLQQLDDVSTVKALGVLTWLLDDVAPWASGVGAVDVLGEATAETPTIQDPVVLGALRSLTNSVNRSTGLGHPSDWDHAVPDVSDVEEARTRFRRRRDRGVGNCQRLVVPSRRPGRSACSGDRRRQDQAD